MQLLPGDRIHRRRIRPAGKGTDRRIGQGRVHLMGVPAAVLVLRRARAVTGDIGHRHGIAAEKIVHAFARGIEEDPVV
ncbi:hypothetical protein D9M70_646690 [compost metagenome]